MRVNQFMSRIFRRKILHIGEEPEVVPDPDGQAKSGEQKGGKLARHMKGWDLTALGIGSTLGAGIYVITGAVAHDKSGPSIVVSFAIAGLASILAGLSYAEFGSRVPKAGSAYVYSFVAVGELIAWITGWNLILEYIIGASSVARGWSSYFNALTGNFIQDNINNHMPDVVGGDHGDIFSFFITMLLTVLVGFGVKESTRVNNVLTVVNLTVVVFVVIAGLFYVNLDNWNNFAPFGVQGVFKGAATCFYAYIGFDVIATSAEETIKPEKNVPFGIVTSLTACALSYMAVSAVVTLMVAFHDIDTSAPLSNAFAVNGASWAKILIAVGALCGLSTSLMAAIFPLPRIIYAIANDGLLWPWLGHVHRRFHTPLNATIISGLLAGLMAFLFNINELADMMSIGTLMSYSLVSACVIILRYEPPSAEEVMAARLAKDTDPLVLSENRHYDTSEINPDMAGALVDTPRLNELQKKFERGRWSGDGRVSGNEEKSRSVSLSAASSRARAFSADHTQNVRNGQSDLSAGRISGQHKPEGESSPLLQTDVTAANMHHHDVVGNTEEDEHSSKHSQDKHEAQQRNSEAYGSLLNISKPQRVNKSCGWYSSFVFTVMQQHHRADVFKAVVELVLLYTAFCSIASFLAIYCSGTVCFSFTMIFTGFALLTMVLTATVPPEAQDHLAFKCPFVPVLPMLSMAINIYLLASLDLTTWIRFAVWTFLGFAIYFGYGMRNSKTPERRWSTSSGEQSM